MPGLGVGFTRQAEQDVTPYETRLVELLDQLEATLKEVRAHLALGRQEDPASSEAVEAFADEVFRDRDA